MKLEAHLGPSDAPMIRIDINKGNWLQWLVTIAIVAITAYLWAR